MEYTSLQSFYFEEEAAALAEMFSKNGIDSRVVKVKPIVDEVIIGNDMDRKFHFK
jgi:hypothetical protein